MLPSGQPLSACTLNKAQIVTAFRDRTIESNQPRQIQSIKMPSASVKNPNCISRNRQRALRSKARKQTLQAVASARLPDRVAKADTKRGARTGLLPTSGPNKPLSRKKARKLEKQMAHAIRRKREEEEKKSQVEMKGQQSQKAVFTTRTSGRYNVLTAVP